MVSMDTETGVLAVTEKAAQKALSLAGKEGFTDPHLRVRVVAGGCSGFSYKLSFEPQAAEADQVIDAYGLKVLVDPKSAAILAGSTLEFNDAMLGGGFRVNNPQAVHECACGESFSV
jgi:iron-sulfur cluster assembly accessory protein